MKVAFMSESTAHSFAMVLKVWIGDNFIGAEGPFRFSLDGTEVRITDCIGQPIVDLNRPFSGPDYIGCLHQDGLLSRQIFPS